MVYISMTVPTANSAELNWQFAVLNVFKTVPFSLVESLLCEQTLSVNFRSKHHYHIQAITCWMLAFLSSVVIMLGCGCRYIRMRMMRC